MKTFKLYYYLIFLLKSFTMFSMVLDTDSKQKKIDNLKENPDKIAKILKEKKCWHSCFYTPTDVEIAEEAQRELAKDIKKVQSLKPEELNQQIINFSPYQIKLLTNDQIVHINLTALNNLQEDQLKAFTSDKLQILIKKIQDELDHNNPADRKNIYTETINIENMLNFIDKINKLPLSIETQDLIYILKKTIYQNLTPEKLKAISNRLKNEDIFQAIKFHFNNRLDSVLKNILTYKFLNNPQEFNPEYIPYIHINEIEPFEISILDPNHIKHLRLEQVKSLTDKQIEALTSNQANVFSRGQIMNLSSYQVGHLISSKKISLNQILYIPPKTFSLIDPEIIENLSLDQLDALTDNQIKELSNSTKISLLKKLTEIGTDNNKEFKTIINKIIIRINDAITALSKKEFNYYHENIFKHLKHKIPTINPAAHLHQMNIDDIKFLSAEMFRSLSREEKHDILEEIEKHYQTFNAEELLSIIDQYQPKEIKNLIGTLIKAKKDLADKDDNQFSIKDIMKLNDDHLLFIQKTYQNMNLKNEFEQILKKYYRHKEIDQLKKDIPLYKSNFIKNLLLNIDFNSNDHGLKAVALSNDLTQKTSALKREGFLDNGNSIIRKKNPKKVSFLKSNDSEMLDETELLSFIHTVHNKTPQQLSSSEQTNESKSNTLFHTPQNDDDVE